MEPIAPIDLLSRWWQGDDIRAYLLFGYPVLWWGRLGKFLQMVAGLTIMAEILGPDRLSQFGHALRSALAPERFAALFEALFYVPFAAARRIRAFFTPPNVETRAQHAANFEAQLSGALNMILSLALYWWVIRPQAPDEAVWKHVFNSLAVFAGYFFVIVPLGLVVVVFILVAGAASASVLVVQPVACLLARKDFETLIKIASVALLVIGFLFEMLSQ